MGEYAEIHPDTHFYDVPGFIENPSRSTLFDLERDLVGEVSEKSLVHLQCHIGLDTLSWAREGASVVGVDFAETAVETAREIRDDAGLTDDASFVCCDVREAADHLDREFDVVFASYGVLCWIPDLDAWMATAAALCKPGGRFVLADGHPILDGFDWDLTLREDAVSFRTDPIEYDEQGTYADWDATVEHTRGFEWQHTLGDIVTAAADARFRIDELRESPVATFQGFGAIEETSPGEFRLPGDPLPLTYALVATAEEGPAASIADEPTAPAGDGPATPSSDT